MKVVLPVRRTRMWTFTISALGFDWRLSSTRPGVILQVDSVLFGLHPARRTFSPVSHRPPLTRWSSLFPLTLLPFYFSFLNCGLRPPTEFLLASATLFAGSVLNSCFSLFKFANGCFEWEFPLTDCVISLLKAQKYICRSIFQPTTHCFLLLVSEKFHFYGVLAHRVREKLETRFTCLVPLFVKKNMWSCDQYVLNINN